MCHCCLPVQRDKIQHSQSKGCATAVYLNTMYTTHELHSVVKADRNWNIDPRSHKSYRAVLYMHRPCMINRIWCVKQYTWSCLIWSEWTLLSCKEQEASEKIKVKMYVSSEASHRIWHLSPISHRSYRCSTVELGLKVLHNKA